MEICHDVWSFMHFYNFNTLIYSTTPYNECQGLINEKIVGQ